MGVVQTRGGAPDVFRDTIDTTGRAHDPRFFTMGIKARNKGANVVRMYFTEDDYTNDENYVELPVAAATDPYGEWEASIEIRTYWLRAVGGSSAVEVVALQRRG